jgi:hypothetical protein
MEIATDHYRSKGWCVDDVSAARTSDLHCIRGQDELRAEVKGTTTGGARILLTRKEVEHACREHPKVAIAIVRNITCGDATATGGILEIREPWAIEAGLLTPVGFSWESHGAR